jgi:hypothetical protein
MTSETARGLGLDVSTGRPEYRVQRRGPVCADEDSPLPLEIGDGFPEWYFSISSSSFVNAPNLDFSGKEYRSEEDQLNPRGQMDPVFSVSEDGKKCLLLRSRTLCLFLDSDGGFVKAISNRYRKRRSVSIL